MGLDSSKARCQKNGVLKDEKIDNKGLRIEGAEISQLRMHLNID